MIIKTFVNIYEEEAYLTADNAVAIDDGTCYSTDSRAAALQLLTNLGYVKEV